MMANRGNALTESRTWYKKMKYWSSSRNNMERLPTNKLRPVMIYEVADRQNRKFTYPLSRLL